MLLVKRIKYDKLRASAYQCSSLKLPLLWFQCERSLLESEQLPCTLQDKIELLFCSQGFSVSFFKDAGMFLQLDSKLERDEKRCQSHFLFVANIYNSACTFFRNDNINSKEFKWLELIILIIIMIQKKDIVISSDTVEKGTKNCQQLTSALLLDPRRHTFHGSGGGKQSQNYYIWNNNVNYNINSAYTCFFHYSLMTQYFKAIHHHACGGKWWKERELRQYWMKTKSRLQLCDLGFTLTSSG